MDTSEHLKSIIDNGEDDFDMEVLNVDCPGISTHTSNFEGINKLLPVFNKVQDLLHDTFSSNQPHRGIELPHIVVIGSQVSQIIKCSPMKRCTKPTCLIPTKI